MAGNITKFEEYFNSKAENQPNAAQPKKTKNDRDLFVFNIIQLFDEKLIPENKINIGKLGKVIHITGTNGKGSTSHLTSQLLHHSGYKTSLFTSPHVEYINERIVINGENVSNELLDKAFLACKDVIQANNLHYFIGLFYCYLYIVSELIPTPLDYSVIEVGIGGTHDATNLASYERKDAVLTSISYDHVSLLGDTLQAIATEKLGIVNNNTENLFIGKSYTPAIIDDSFVANSDFDDTAKKLLNRAKFENNIVDEFIENRVSQLRNEYKKFTPFFITENDVLTVKSMLDNGNNTDNNITDYYLHNLALALRIVKTNTNNDKINLDDCKLPPARLEIVGGSFLIDGAHNFSSLLNIAVTIKNKNLNPKVALISCIKDRDINEFIQILKAILPATKIYITNIQNDIEASINRETYDKDDVIFIKDYKDAYNTIKRVYNGVDDLKLITGSFYLCGAVRTLLTKET